jgi:hypothetical protein
MPEVLNELPGAQELIDWFGSWPSFHDAEVTGVNFSRDAATTLDIHVFRITPELTPTGHYKTDKHAIVTFSTSEMVGGSLDGFNNQNVIFGLRIERVEEGYRLDLDPCYGLAGSLLCKDLAVTFIPGLPVKSIYRETA